MLLDHRLSARWPSPHHTWARMTRTQHTSSHAQPVTNRALWAAVTSWS
jgi:hypothetical protein